MARIDGSEMHLSRMWPDRCYVDYVSGSEGETGEKVPLPDLCREKEYGTTKEQEGSVRPVWDVVIEDMKARDHIGRERYGRPLTINNGRDALQDAYEEALDLAVYLKQAILEREQLAKKST